MIKHPFHLCALLLVLLFINCKTYVDVDKPNQKQPFSSPIGIYILRVPIEPVLIATDPGNEHYYWRVTISDTSGKLLFKDDSSFVGNLNVYWYWDKDDRAWLNNSDDGSVYYWQHDSKGSWKRYEWQESNKELPEPPAELFPEHSAYKK
jgi:hypothetical protein